VIWICLETQAVGDCSDPAQRLGDGHTDATGRFVDAEGLPGIALSAAIQPGQCVFAYHAELHEVSDMACASDVVPAPAPAFSSLGLIAAVLLLCAVARCRMRQPGASD